MRLTLNREQPASNLTLSAPVLSAAALQAGVLSAG